MRAAAERNVRVRGLRSAGAEPGVVPGTGPLRGETALLLAQGIAIGVCLGGQSVAGGRRRETGNGSGIAASVPDVPMGAGSENDLPRNPETACRAQRHPKRR